jgi:hypothetical protein
MGSQLPLRQRCDPPSVTPKPFSLQMKIYFLSTSHPVFLAKMVLILLVPLLSFIARTHVKEDARSSSVCSTAGSDLLFIFGNFEFQKSHFNLLLNPLLDILCILRFCGHDIFCYYLFFPTDDVDVSATTETVVRFGFFSFLSVYIQHFTGHPS